MDWVPLSVHEGKLDFWSWALNRDIQYTDIELQCCTPEIYITLLTNITSKYSLWYQVIWISVRQQKWRLFVNKVLHLRRLITMFQIYSCSLEPLLDCHQSPSLKERFAPPTERSVTRISLIDFSKPVFSGLDIIHGACERVDTGC